VVIRRLELTDDLAVPAGCEVMVDHQLDRREPQLLQPADLGAGERLVGDVVERRSAPQPQRVARRTVRDEALEQRRVDAVWSEAELVAVAARDDLGAVGTGAQRLAQLGDVPRGALA
jgi:hypothetical protein